MELRPRHRQVLDGLLRLLERGVVTGGDLDEMLEGTCALYGGAAIALLQAPDFEGPGRQLRIPAAWPAIHERYYAQDPVQGILTRRPPGAAFTLDADLTDEIKERELYAHYRGFGFGDGMVTRIHSPFSSEGLYLVVYRERGRKALTREDRELMRLLHPHLAGALATKCALSHLHAAEGAKAVAAAATILAQVTLSYPGQRIEWTPAARALWRRRLGAINASGWARIERMILRAAQRCDRWDVGGRSQILASGLRIEFASLPPRPRERRRISALFLDAREPPKMRLGPVVELLSRRQGEVALEAARGKTTAEIALALGISTETARSHLRAVFQRLGVTRRAELVQFLEPTN